MPRPKLSLILVLLAVLFAAAPSAKAYSVLSHEEVVDLLWTPQIVPMLRARYPGITDEQLRQAHAYAYGGSVIQDIGYYPFGSRYFSDLLHYVRTGDFVEALIRGSATPDEYAFALGALAHYCGDVVGHPYINLVTADEYPILKKKYGKSVTYEQDSTAHLRTEFGFDVVGVADGVYSQENYRAFIGFEVAKPLLERAFHETYGLPMSSVIKHEDLAIATYRYAVSTIIPRMTKVALVSYHDQIEKAHPGFDQAKFLYRFRRTEFDKQYGHKYKKPSFGTHVLGIVFHIFPKVGPFRALQLSIPNGDQQTLYLRSMNESVDRFRLELTRVRARPSSLPAVAAGKDEDAADKAAQKQVDVAVRQVDRQIAQEVKDAKAAADNQPDAAPVKPVIDLALEHKAAEKSVADAPQPRSPELADIDLDTGKQTAEGEYRLADETHAHLLADLIGQRVAAVPPELRAKMLGFYAKSATQDDALRKKPRQWKKVEAHLATFRSQKSAPVETASR